MTRPPSLPQIVAALSCYIDGCDQPATFVVHSYPDTVRLCDRHKSLHGRLEPFERVCAGVGCELFGPACFTISNEEEK